MNPRKHDTPCYIKRARKDRKSVYELAEHWQLAAEFTDVYRSVEIEYDKYVNIEEI